jgi:uncharacterized membrane protein
MRARGFIIGTILSTVSYEFFQRLAGPAANSFFGAFVVGVVITITAAMGLGCCYFYNGNIDYTFDQRILLLLAGVGLSAYLLDLCSLFAYRRGIELSVFAPLVAGGVIVLASFVGIPLGEKYPPQKIAAIALIFAGCLWLAKI